MSFNSDFQVLSKNQLHVQKFKVALTLLWGGFRSPH